MKTSDRRIKWAGVIGFVTISAVLAQTPPPLPPPAPKLPPELLQRPPVKPARQDPLVNRLVQLPTNAVPAPATPLPLIPAAPVCGPAPNPALDGPGMGWGIEGICGEARRYQRLVHF